MNSKVLQVFESQQYLIYEILEGDDVVHQYRVQIREHCRPTNRSAEIDRDCYSPIEDGLEGAHKTAEFVIGEYFSGKIYSVPLQL